MTMIRKLSLAVIAALCLGANAMAEEDGQSLYNHKCATCHQQNGSGIAHAFPALSGDATLLGDDAELVSLVFRGRGGMPSWVYFLKDDQLAKILTYARAAWGNGAPPVSVETITALRKTIPGASQNPLGN